MKRIFDRLDHKDRKNVQEKTNIDLNEQSVNVYARILRGLSNPIRIVMLLKVSKDGKYNNELAKITGLGSASLNYHLVELRSSGLISQETSRGKYVITGLGLEALSLMTNLGRRASYKDTIEIDRYCWLCNKATMKIDIYPTYFQCWCPACGGEHGKKWSMTGVNPYGEDWRLQNLDDFLDKGWKMIEELLKESIKDGKCHQCGAKINYLYEDRRVHGYCPGCGSHNCWSFNNVEFNIMLPIWRRYKNIKHLVKGPVERNGVNCWEVSVSTDDDQFSVTQYRKLKSGDVVDEVRSEKNHNETEMKAV